MKHSAIFLAALLSIILLLCSCGKNGTDSEEPSDRVLVSISPADGAVNVASDAIIVVDFDHPMMMDSVQDMFMLHRGWGVGTVPIDGAVSWNAEQTRLSFRPAAGLEANRTYTVHLMGMLMGDDHTMYHPMRDPMHMGGMNSGMMMGGMGADEIRSAFSTGPTIVHQLTLDLSQDVVLVADGGSGDIAVIDPSTNTLIAVQPIDTVGFLHHVYLSSDGSKLLVSDPGENLSAGHGSGEGHGEHGGGNEGSSAVSRIVVIDTRTLLETGRILLAGMVHNAVMTPDGQHILLANTEHNVVHRYDAGTFVETASYSVQDEPLETTVTPDGRYALVANSGSGTVTRLDLQQNGSAQHVPVGSRPIGAWITPDGQKAWVSNEGSKSITVITIDPLGVDTTLELGYTPGQAFVNPVRAEAYIADEDNGRVQVFDLETRAFVASIPTGRRAHGIAFSPDGQRAYVTNEMDHTVTVLNCPSRTIVATVRVGINPNGILFRDVP